MSARQSASLARGGLDWDHLHLYVGNAKQAAHYFATAFGFRIVAYAGPETGRPGQASYALVQGAVRIAVTSSLGGDGTIAVCRHGDGIRDVALPVADARAAYASALAGGATGVVEPHQLLDADGRVVLATIATYGDTVHTFVERQHYAGPFLPGYVAEVSSSQARAAPFLDAIDHCVGNVGWNEMDAWVAFYGRAFGFTQLVSFDDRDISTQYSALRSKVVADDAGRVKFPINEPALGARTSQIEEYLACYGGPGVQHVAIATNDIVAAVTALRDNGVAFLDTPMAYYDDLATRVGTIDESIATLRDLRILVDRDDRGYMLQIFTKPLGDRPTLFFEIIQRRGSVSFGKGNFRALFASIEAEQARRGNL
ncbi:MAG: 4-hydroxyphenylpyruvate dioxygenase [Vulcanimicrobiaceae bacterium]